MSRIPNSGSGNFRGRNQQNRGPRRNERIRAREIRVIKPDGTQLGVMLTDEARRLAKEAGLDLVEISPNARPPVCRILDFGKYKYELSKKQKDSKQSTSKLKEVKFRVRTEEHDYMTKVKRAEGFVFKGNKVKLSLQFRGREMEHQELGFQVLERAAKDLEQVGHRESDAKRAGRQIAIVITPLPTNKRKLIHNVEVPEDDQDDHESDHDVDDYDYDIEETAEKEA